MDRETRDFFVSVLLGSRKLSECKEPEAALISRGKDVISVQHTKHLTSNKDDFLSSPVIDVIIDYYKKTENNEDDEEALFSTHFPSYTEFQALHNTPIRVIYFFGNVSDEKSCKLLNQLGKEAVEGGVSDDYTIINLKT
jgi:hypothetical protein